jgi:hypothetical protein
LHVHLFDLVGAVRVDLAGTPPGVNVTSLTGRPLIVASLPPTWKEPMALSVIGGWTSSLLARSAPSAVDSAVTATNSKLKLSLGDMRFLLRSRFSRYACSRFSPPQSLAAAAGWVKVGAVVVVR